MFFIVRCTKQQSAVYLQRVGLKHSQHLLHFSHHYHPTEKFYTIHLIDTHLWGATHKIRKLIFFSVYILITSIFFNGKFTSFNWKRSPIKKQRETLSTVKLITSILHIKLKMVMHIQYNNQ